MNILITEKQLNILKESIETSKPTEEKFIKEVKNFLYNVLSGTVKNANNFWKINGLNNTDVINKLKRFGILVYDDGSDSYKALKKNFDRKVSRLYYDLFPEQELISEDGEGMAMGGDGGATTAGSAGGSYDVPFMTSPMKRTIPNIISK